MPKRTPIITKTPELTPPQSPRAISKAEAPPLDAHTEIDGAACHVCGTAHDDVCPTCGNTHEAKS